MMLRVCFAFFFTASVLLAQSRVSVSTEPVPPSFHGGEVVVRPAPLEAPGGVWISSSNAYLIIRMPDGHDYAIIPVDGEVISPQVSFSPLELDQVPGFVESAKTNHLARKARIAAIKESAEWEAITNNLAQYELHDAQWQSLRSAATNALAATTGVNKAAFVAIVNLVEKERQARDDVKVIAAKTKGVLMDIVKESK